MKRRILRRLVYAVLVLFIVAATAVALCAGTPFGSRWLIQGAVAASGQPLTIGRIEGTLLEGLTLADIRYRSEPVTVSVAALALRWRPIGLLAGELTLSALDGRRINIDLAASDAPADTDERGRFSMPALPLGFDVNQSNITDITIDRDGEAFHIEALELAGSVNNERISIKRLSVKHADFGVSTSARLDTHPPHAVQAEVQWYAGDDARRLAAGEATFKGSLDTMDFTHRLTQPLTVNSTGKLKGLLQQPVVNAESTLPAQSLASVGLDGWTLKESRAHTEGWIDDYRWNADFGVDAEQWPQNRGRAEGRGTLSGLAFEQFTVRTLEGELTGSGELAWMPRLEWQTQVKAEGLDPGVIQSRWPGALSFSTHNSGFYDYESGRYAVKTRDLSLSGRLQTRRVAASGGLDISSEVFEAHAFNLSVGANRLSLNGSLANGAGRSVDLAWNLNLADLSAVPLPGQAPMTGRVSGRGRVGGSLQDPRINARLDATDLGYDTISAGTVQLNATHSAAGGHDIRLTAGNLVFDTFKVPAAELTIQGQPADHSIQFNARSEPTNIALAFDDGALALQPDRPWQWQSTLQRLDLYIARAGDWRLARGARLNASPTRLSVAESCLKQDGARLCSTAEWHRPEGFDIKGQIQQLPMSLLHPWIAANTRLDGRINGEFAVTGTGPSLRSRVQLASPAGRFMITDEDDEADVYAWRRLAAEFSHDNETTQGRVDFDLAQLGRIHGGLTMTPEERLQGELQASIDDIGWLELLLPRLRELTGALQADINVSGTRERPRIAGRATLAGAGAEIPALGIAVTDMRATIDGDNNAFDIESTATSGPGQLRAKGGLKLKPDWQYELDMQLAGEAFEIVNLQRADVQINPDVRLRLTPSIVEATGVVKLPVTHINLKTMPASAVSVSPDAQIAGQAGPAANGGRAINANLKLLLGDEVHFNGLGLQARLTGELDLTETPGQPPLAYGELEVVEGRYKAYGQKLQLDGGRLIFRGPYDNPTLNVRAVRETPDATVGLHLTGTLKQPHSRVFSEPPLPDSEATALLLTGRSLSSASESDANMLINAVAALGMERSEGITRQIAQTFNLDEIKIQAGSGFEEGSLLLGKHLSPRLYIQYVVGFLNQAGQLNLEYRLTENLKLEARSGDERSMDLMYKIER